MKRIGIVVAAVALLPGCGLPIGVQLAFLAADGISLVATDKTPSDHALSAIAEQDCAMWRPFKGDPICSNLPAAEPDGARPGTAVAEGEPAQPEVVVAEAVPPLPRPTGDVTFSSWALPDISTTDVAAASDTAAEAAAPVPPIKRAAPPAKIIANLAKPSADSIYLVVASFDTTDRARNMAGRHAALKPQVVRGEAKGATVYRVVVGPFAKSDQVAQRHRLEVAGIADAWPLPYTAVQVAAAPTVKPVQMAEAAPSR